VRAGWERGGSLVLIAAGLAWFSRVPVDASYFVDVMPALLLFGIGAGLAFPSLVTLAMSGATEHDSGLASGLVNTTQQVGGAFGLAVLASLSTTRTDTLLGTGLAEGPALTSGYQLAFTIGAGLVVAAFVIAVTVLQPAEAGAERDEAEELGSPVADAA
jgi:hypothetical protein